MKNTVIIIPTRLGAKRFSNKPLARIKNVPRKFDVLPFLNSVYSKIELDVNSISMYESKLFPEGTQYTVLDTFPLN